MLGSGEVLLRLAKNILIGLEAFGPIVKNASRAVIN